MTEIVVPTLGESVAEATVAQWLKKEGEAVQADEPIVELETDKVTLEVNAPEAGTISKIIAAEGANVEVGAILGEIGAAGGVANDSSPDKGKETAGQQSKKEESAEDSAEDDSDSDADASAGAGADAEAEADADAESQEHKLSPAVRKLIEEHNLDPAKIPASGKDGRLVKEDVLKFIGGSAASDIVTTPVVAEEKGGAAAQSASASSASPAAAATREERVKMTRLRQSIARRLKEAQNTAAMLTTFNEVDMGAVMDLRKDYKDAFEKKHGVKLGFMSFFIKACVNALKEFPAVNAEIDGDEMVYKNYYDISVAVSTPQGLVVPVIRDCEGKSMARIEKDIIDFGTRAREGKISLDEMQGGTFTITNGGIFGSMMSTPILNAPQSGILGMHNIVQRPVVQPDGSIIARPMMYLALSYDHRIIDGREAVTFLVRVKQAIEDPQRLVLDL